MSVQSEIQRIQQAKADILSAIASKNIIVPPETTLADAPNLIRMIENSTTNNLTWQKLLDENEFVGLSQYTDNIKYIPWPGSAILVSQNQVDYDVVPCFGQGYIATLGNIVINAGDDYSDTYNISFDNGNSWEFDVLSEELEGGIIGRCFTFNQKIIMDANNHIFFSSDGINWTRSKNGDFYIIKFVTSPQGILVTTSSDREAFYSFDGDTWIQVDIELEKDNGFSDAIYDGERYYLLCNNSFYHSTDLVTWEKEEINAGVITDIIRYTFSSGAFGWVLSSSEGIYWCSNLSNNTSNHSWIRYLEGHFVALESRVGRIMAYGLGSPQDKIWTSTNVDDWYECTPTNFQDLNGVYHYDSRLLKCDGTAFYTIGNGLLKAY